MWGFTWTILGQALFFALPMYVANMTPILVAGIPVLDQPIDGGRLWRGQPILGSHKTWRGLIAGTAMAVLIVYLQRLFVFYHGPALAGGINYFAADIWQLGLLLGFGALAGDAVKSFFKRRLGRKPGSAWIPFDQIDFVVGGLCAAAFYTPIAWQTVVLLLILTPIGHVLVNRAAFAAGWKSVPY